MGYNVDNVDDRGYSSGRLIAMPSPPHEVLIVALREQPALLRSLVTKLSEASLPRGVHPIDASLRFVKPAEVRMDLVLQNRSKEWVIVELQLAIDPEKRKKWLLAASLLLNQTGVLGDVIVITARRSVGRWASRVAQLQTPLGTKLSLTPVVLTLGMKEAEALLDQEQPELALFAAWAMQHRHGSKARDVVERAIDLTESLPPALRRPQMDAIVSVLSERMFALFQEDVMNPDKSQERPAVRRFRLLMQEQGRMEGKQGALVTLLEARGLSLTAHDRATIAACVDSDELDRWIVAAATASSIKDVLRSAPKTAASRTRGKRTATPRATTPSRKSARAIKP
jgi:hypothetical protein